MPRLQFTLRGQRCASLSSSHCFRTSSQCYSMWVSSLRSEATHQSSGSSTCPSTISLTWCSISAYSTCSICRWCNPNTLRSAINQLWLSKCWLRAPNPRLSRLRASRSILSRLRVGASIVGYSRKSLSNRHLRFLHPSPRGRRLCFSGFLRPQLPVSRKTMSSQYDSEQMLQ